MKIYRIKKLIDGYKLKPELKSKIFVCCKTDKNYTHIQHDNVIMKKPAEPAFTLGPFSDNYGREAYFLDYYEWQPISAENLWQGIK